MQVDKCYFSGWRRLLIWCGVLSVIPACDWKNVVIVLIHKKDSRMKCMKSFNEHSFMLLLYILC